MDLRPMNLSKDKSHNRRYLHRFLVFDQKERRMNRQDDEVFGYKNPGNSWYPMFIINRKTNRLYHRNDGFILATKLYKNKN